MVPKLGWSRTGGVQSWNFQSKVWSQRSRSWSCYGCQRLLSNAFFLESRLLEWMCLGNCPRRIKTLFGSTKIACFSLMRFWIVNSSRAETEKPISKSLIGVKQRLHFRDASVLGQCCQLIRLKWGSFCQHYTLIPFLNEKSHWVILIPAIVSLINEL